MQSAFTHPDYATLVDPLFAARKEGEESLRGCKIAKIISELPNLFSIFVHGF